MVGKMKGVISEDSTNMALSYYTNGLPSEGWKKAAKKAEKKKGIAGKMVSKEYKTVRCGHCGKFGHSHETHKTGKYSVESKGLAGFREYMSNPKSTSYHVKHGKSDRYDVDETQNNSNKYKV
jgi:hypothetical protein